jgi:hypothetical protein
MANPTITNMSITSRFEKFALASSVVIDGSEFSADASLLKGTILVKKANGKWRKFVHGTDTLALDAVRILQDEMKITAGVDAFAVGFFEGFFRMAALSAVNSGLVAADLTVAAGFHFIDADEVRLK